jgi:hypothetical protein
VRSGVRFVRSGTDVRGRASMPVLTGGEDGGSVAEVGGEDGEAWVGWSGGEGCWLSDTWGGEGFECAECRGEQVARGKITGPRPSLRGKGMSWGFGVRFGVVLVVFVVRRSTSMVGM